MLTHLQRLEAESIHIIREAVAESERPVMLYSIGKDSAVLLHLAMKAFYPAKPPFPLLHVDTTWKFRAMYEMRDTVAAAVRRRPDRVPEPGMRRAGHQPDHARLGAAHRPVEDRGTQAGARQVRLRPRLRRRPARRGEVPGQGAGLLRPLRPAPLGPEGAASRAVARLQRPQAPRGEHPRVPAVELDRAGRLALHPARGDPGRTALLRRRAPRGRAGRRADHGGRRPPAAAARERCRSCARCASAPSAATR